MSKKADRMTFEGIGIEIGKPAGDGVTWADVTMRVFSPSLNYYPSVLVSVLLPCSPATPLGELEEAARAGACDVLRTVAGLLEGSTVEALRERQAAEEAERQAELDRIGFEDPS